MASFPPAFAGMAYRLALGEIERNPPGHINAYRYDDMKEWPSNRPIALPVVHNARLVYSVTLYRYTVEHIPTYNIHYV